MDKTFPLPPDIKPTALYVCFTANIFVLKSESSPQLTPPAPHLLGWSVWIHGNLTSAVRFMNPGTYTFICVFLVFSRAAKG